MTFLKSICILLISIFYFSIEGNAQQASTTYTIEWFGYNRTISPPNGVKVSYPYAKDAFVNSDGVLVLQKDIVGKIVGTVSLESATYYAGDSSSKAALQKLTTPQKPGITYKYLYNDKLISRIFIPILQKNSDGVWSQLSSATIQYTLSDVVDETPIRNSYSSNPSYSNARVTSTTGSVLASGDWYKVSVSETGIYKIDVAFLTTLGINTSNINPSTIQLYGNGGGMLPQANSASRLDDLVENSIFLSEDGNGRFDNNDYILFYGESPHTWELDATNKTFSHTFNLYSDQNFYFLRFNQQPGKRIAIQPSIGGTAQTLTTFDEHSFIEQDIYNLQNSGREWYGFQFSQFITNNTNANNPYSFNITGITSAAPRFVSAVVGRSYNSSSFQYAFNGNPLFTQVLPTISTADHQPVGNNVVTAYTLPPLSGTTLNVSMTLSGTNPLANSNYLELQFEKFLRLYGTQTSFRSIKSLDQPTTSYSVSNVAGNESVWDVTDPRNVIAQDYSFTGSSLEFGTNSSSLREFIIFSGSSFSKPTFVERVANQNLHMINTGSIPEMIVVTHPNFLSQAQRLASFREANDGIKVYVCTVNQVYNEFASGKSDLTAIRDFAKMVYDRGSATEQLKYVLLFGAATCDYKNHLGAGGNFVPTYESRESLDELRSYNSDDYYGFMDNTEGNWGEIQNAAEANTLNIGIGRIPVRTAAQAEIVVNKLISASKPSLQTNSNWKNKMTFIADDGNNNLHIQTSEDLANKIAASNKKINVNKIYLDAYPQESSPSGKKSPQTNEAINRSVDEGNIIWNYTGHGGDNVLAQEEIVTTTTISNWNNINRLSFFITATCSFGRFDKPGLISGAEQIFLSPLGGSFGNLTSTRTVLSNTNATINEDLYDYVFGQNTDGSYFKLGDIIKGAKNLRVTETDVYNRNYTFLGDPSMRMSYPIQNMVVTAINGNPISAIPDTLKALSKVTIEGLVQDFSGTTLTGYSGVATITIYDKPSVVNTLGGSPDSPITTFKLQNNIIFNGAASVTNGAFKVSFVVPKDISYQYEYGKVSLYSQKTNGTLDAGGSLSSIVVGGSNPNAPIDKTPPTVKLYLNDPSFVSGGITRENAIFYADVSDENGINISTSGIGHEITLVLSNSTDVIILNKYYTASKDDYTKGKVIFPLEKLAPGSYSLRFKVWDTYNNSTEDVLEFTVESTTNIQLSHVLNYPNPFSTNTTFHFDHNRFGDNLTIQIQIYTVSGKLVKTLDETVYNSPSHISDIHWNGLDDYGDKIGRGVYVYKLKIRSLQDGSTTHVFEKLVLL